MRVMRAVGKCLFVVCGVFLLLTGCTVDKECRLEYSARLAVLLQVDSVSASNDTVRLEALDSLSVWGRGQDSLWLNNQKKVTYLSLPLRVDTTCTEYVLSVNASGEEHLCIYHQNMPRFISLACGCFVYYTIDSITCSGDLVDRVEILNAQVENVSQDNVRLYFVLKP